MLARCTNSPEPKTPQSWAVVGATPGGRPSGGPRRASASFGGPAGRRQRDLIKLEESSSIDNDGLYRAAEGHASLAGRYKPYQRAEENSSSGGGYRRGRPAEERDGL
ncbi:hypothetical protein PCANC_10809 [Puccinia coronata f. sp. avenae]|uniref:Uncharacterized protein n=1 Tax=Puccinia coronata f. sp. avenae TaxID=200324 RepID=A0A2N5V4E4_9BASI|nr:hypothetical protein PCANC_10809 [Puccinia coronata f. sp. avenae]